MHADGKAEVIYDFLKVIQNHLNKKTSWGRNQLLSDIKGLAFEFLGRKSKDNLNSLDEIPWPEEII